MNEKKPMVAYVASSFRLASDLPRIQAMLKATGWIVEDEWWEKDEKGSLPADPEQFYANPVVKAIVARHWAAIRNADALVLVADLINETRFTGASIEFGFAQALGIPCVIVGKVKNSAMWANAIHCKTWAEMIPVMADLNYRNPRN